MTSPQKGKEKKKEPAQSKKRQLLSAFHQHVQFLQIFSSQELDYLQQKIHIFVFTRGQVLSKQKELIDYIGIIAQGRAIAKSRPYEIGDLIGQGQLLGYQQLHPESIIGESDGILIALRIFDLMTMDKMCLRNKILSQTAALYIGQISKREEISKQILQFQTIDEKKIQKYLTSEWSAYYKQMDPKQKSKFINYFPFYSVKQKQMIVNHISETYLLYVVHGQAIAKSKQQQKIIQSGKIYNLQGFTFNQTGQENIYCLSSQAVIVLIDKGILQSQFKTETFKGILSIVMNELTQKYTKQQIPSLAKEEKDKNQWSIFKKYPNSQILPLPKKSELHKSKKTQNNNLKESNLATYQTLFKQQLGPTDSKLKTNTSVAESGYQKLYSLKTQSQGKQLQNVLEVEKLRKQVDLLTEKLKFTEQMSKTTKLQLIQSKSKTAMSDVMKQIRKLYQQNQIAHSNPKQNEIQGGQSLLTLKQAFDKQTKQNKIQILVAKCAFRWLYLTRKKKGMVKNNSSYQTTKLA